MLKNLLFSIFIALGTIFLSNCQETGENYVCPPCDLPCDSLAFTASGDCPECNMPLVVKTQMDLVVDDIVIHPGPGKFLISGGKGQTEKTITVYFNRPLNFTPQSKILLVLPGAGRNGNDYRDAWQAASEKYNVLVLSPSYPEKSYDFGAYHMGGLLYDFNLQESVSFSENTNEVFLDEDKLSFKINRDKQSWLFNDFERIFDAALQATASRQISYDLFGHSAGGQILHRFTLFGDSSRAAKIIAANTGFYTLSDSALPLPFGMKDTGMTDEKLVAAFQKQLVVFLGEADNQDETRGYLLRSPSADAQGGHRLARGEYFFQFSMQQAKTLAADFKWQLIKVPGVGHDYNKMSAAAARYLYGNN